MEPDEVCSYLNERITLYLQQQPFWLGNLPMDQAATKAGVHPKGQQPEWLKHAQTERKQERLDREQRLATRLEELSNAQPTATA